MGGEREGGEGLAALMWHANFSLKTVTMYKVTA